MTQCVADVSAAGYHRCVCPAGTRGDACQYGMVDSCSVQYRLTPHEACSTESVKAHGFYYNNAFVVNKPNFAGLLSCEIHPYIDIV